MEKETRKTAAEEKKQEKSGIFRTNLIIFLTVIFVFAVIMIFTGLLGEYMGKTAENIALIVIAAVLVFLFIKSKRS